MRVRHFRRWAVALARFCAARLLRPWALAPFGFRAPGLLRPWAFAPLGFRAPGRLRLWALAPSCLLACRSNPATGTPGGGTPFTVSTLGTGYGIQAQLQGALAIQNRWVYVVVPRGSVRTYQRDRQDYWDLRVRAAIATCRPNGVEIASEGRAERLAPLLGLARDSATLDTTMRAFRDTLRLDVAVPPGIDPARSWTALMFEWPFQNVLATYTVHVNLPLNGSSRAWTGLAAESARERCR